MHLPDGPEIAARDALFAELYAELAWIHVLRRPRSAAHAGVRLIAPCGQRGTSGRDPPPRCSRSANCPTRSRAPARSASGSVSPGSTPATRRSARTGSGRHAVPRVVPHSDGAGVIDAVGEGVDAGRGSASGCGSTARSRIAPFGTAAELTVVPAELAVELPDRVGDELGACLGIPGITAHRAVFGDGPVAGRDGPGPRRPRWRRLAGGAAGRRDGATVIGTVRRSSDLDPRPPGVAQPSRSTIRPVAAIRAHAPDGVDRIVEVALSENVDLDAAVIATAGSIAAYATAARAGAPLLADAVRQRHDPAPRQRRLPGRREARGRGRPDRRRPRGSAPIPIGDPLPLDRIAEAHDRVDSGTRERVLVRVP